MSNQPCKARLEVINVNSNNPIFYPFSIKKIKCSGHCNDINDPYAKLCVPDVVKNLKVFNLMSRTNETKNIKWHETCRCECRLDAIVCNNKQRWNKNKCRCKCKQLIDKGVCDKSCDYGEYLDYKNCICKKRLGNKLVDQCNETIDEVKLTKITHTENENSYKHNSCRVYIVLFSIFFIINVRIDTYFVYYEYMNRNKRDVSKYYDYVYHP